MFTVAICNSFFVSQQECFLAIGLYTGNEWSTLESEE